MKSLGAVFIIFFTVVVYGHSLEYSSYHGSLDGRTPSYTESPLYKVKDTTTFPFRTIGRIGTGCTGTLIGPRHVLTAAHCVYSMKTNEYYSELTFNPGQNGEQLPFGTKEWDKVNAPKEWTVDHNDDYDFALITLKENAGDTLGWLGLRVQNSPYNKNIQIAGYAGEKIFGTLWYSSCKLLSQPTNWLDYDCETQGGMSGSGVVEVENRTNYYVIGVHALGGEEYNSGVRISSYIYEKILSWKN